VPDDRSDRRTADDDVRRLALRTEREERRSGQKQREASRYRAHQ
jgi:hypothetical protein